MKSVNAIPCRGYNPSVFSACKQAENPAPLAQLAFECRRWRIQRERQAAAVRKCESEQPKHERLTAKEPRFALRRLVAGLAQGSRDSLSVGWLRDLHRGAKIRPQSAGQTFHSVAEKVRRFFFWGRAKIYNVIKKTSGSRFCGCRLRRILTKRALKHFSVQNLA